MGCGVRESDGISGFCEGNESRSDHVLRAVRVRRALHNDGPLDTSTQDVLVGLLLNTDTPTPLRIEALQTLTDSTSHLDPSVLYPVRNDPNAYLRYQARSTLQNAQSTDALPQFQ